MSESIFDFGPVVYKLGDSAHDGRRFGFSYDREKTANFGTWNEDGTYLSAPANVAEFLNRAHGTDIVQKKCAFTVAHYDNAVDITADCQEDVTSMDLEDGVVVLGYDVSGPNGARWIDALTLTPIKGIATRPLDKEYRNVIEFVNSK